MGSRFNCCHNPVVLVFCFSHLVVGFAVLLIQLVLAFAALCHLVFVKLKYPKTRAFSVSFS